MTLPKTPFVQVDRCRSLFDSQKMIGTGTTPFFKFQGIRPGSQPAESSLKELFQAYRAIEWTRPVERVVEQSEKPEGVNKKPSPRSSGREPLQPEGVLSCPGQRL